MTCKAKVIVNADDFGSDEFVNNAILKSFDLGLISTTTLMGNRPGFKEACEIAHDNNLKDRIGVHLNLTQGQPLTECIKKYPKFYTNDEMYHSFKGHLLNNEESKVVYLEFQAQIDRIKNEGINPTHIDSHHGIHNFWGIGKVVVELAKRNKISSVRLRVNWGKISSKGVSNSNKFYDFRGKVYSDLNNLRLANSGLAKTKYFCGINYVTPELLSKNVFIEVNTHPWLNEEEIVMDCCIGENLIDLKNKYLPFNHLRTFKSIE
jgi:predicted glycoside hydrolase/deacetylase ChbG (UPF0249 family)